MFITVTQSNSGFDYFLHLGLTDEEVELAIQRSGSVEDALALNPSGPPHIIHSSALAPAPYSESYTTKVSHKEMICTKWLFVSVQCRDARYLSGR